MANPKDFLLNTDYEMDKIIMYDKWDTDPGYTEFYYHGLAFVPLIFGVCAFNQDFSDPRLAPFLQFTQNGFIQFDIWAQDDYAAAKYRNDEDENQKIYYTMYGFEPSNSSNEVPHTSDYAKEMVLNTDYNYCKLYKKGIAEGTTTITHNLGYTPFVLAWWDVGGRVQPVWDGNNSGTNSVTITTTQVIINAAAGTKIHYRIYYDEG